MNDTNAADILAVFGPCPGAIALYEALEARLLAAFPDAEIRVSKTQVSFYAGRMFACASLARVKPRAERPDPYITLSLSLPQGIDSPRLLCVPVRPNRTTLHVVIGRAEELDDEIMGWLMEAHAFARRPGGHQSQKG